MEAKILIVDDAADTRWLLNQILQIQGFTLFEADDVEPALRSLERDRPDAVILDVELPSGSGIDVLKQIKQNFPGIPVIIITGNATVDLAVQAMRIGAYHFLEKPFKSNDQVVVTLERALEDRELKAEIQRLRSQLGAVTALSECMGHSDAVRRVVEQVNSVSRTDFTVVVYGETGSGKELIARAIHQHSPRGKKEFVAVDCGSMPETLIESELFGHEKGAFTGADRLKKGQFELASGGTLFLDEIANLPLPMQAKLLRAIETKSIRRVGGDHPIEVDIRILAAGNEKLEKLVKEGKFREDLFYRLTEFTIQIPALRERREDILYLVKRFIDMTNRELKKRIRGLTPEALEFVENHPWPGNVRELRNVIRRAVLLADDEGLIQPQHLREVGQGREVTAASSAPASLGRRAGDYDVDAEDFSLRAVVKKVVEQTEREVMQAVLSRAEGNKAKAARQLKIDYKTMHYKLKEYGLDSGRGDANG